eukprot:CAMPEP_0119035216 /NCGR_PEP_ID=MMETSP1177-20130426/2160_1 /TAXON_ID=2985 /ORGANISM="Ochromonas sp, Strain CCMP1899" /LENGTH=436 /DNA_ID=CAMNT_0006993197 /DNA_START=108 /DNA_END=1415 /DNA_ORIENTATION=+
MTEVITPVIDKDAFSDLPEDMSTQTHIQNRYCFTYHKRGGKTQSNYEECTKVIASFQTVEHFWRVYDHLIRPNDFKSTTDYHLFKDGIQPMWEDPANKQGGKWMVKLKKGLASSYWEEIVLAMIGEQFDVGNEICGAVCSVRTSEDIISIWNKSSDNIEANNRIRDHMRKILKLPTFISVEYKKHEDSMVDKSSFRNTTVGWRSSTAGNNANRTNPPGENRERRDYTRTEGGANTREHYTHHNQTDRPGTERGERTAGVTGERGGERYPARDRDGYGGSTQPKTAWKTNRVESTGDPVRDRENQLKEQEQAKKDAEKESSWGSRRAPAAATEEVRSSGEGWTSTGRSALASGRDNEPVAPAPPGWVKPASRVGGGDATTGTSSWFRSKGTDRNGGVEPIPVPPTGLQTPVFHSGVSALKKKTPVVTTGQADKVDVW